MNVLFFKITLICYFLGTLAFLGYLLAGKKAMLSRFSLAMTGVGFLFHTAALLVRMFEVGYVSVTHLFDAMAFFAWALVLVFLLVEYRFRIHILGSFVLPLALISLISAAVLPKESGTQDAVIQRAWVYIHTTLALLGAVAFAIAFLVGIMYLIQERLLKSKRFNDLYNKLPSLDILDDLNYKAVILGFAFLTLGIIIGAWGAGYVWGSYLTWDPREIFSLTIWLFYLVVLHGRITMGWRAKRAAYLAIIGFVGVIFSFIGVDLLWRGQHAFM
ncbi:MAG: cytochrome c biogenesis protein CcsA [Nitrospirae bacterium]|nr:cytochrome c biogenesis protein CcsA [Nitrospirota bacterium]